MEITRVEQFYDCVYHGLLFSLEKVLLANQLSQKINKVPLLLQNLDNSTVTFLHKSWHIIKLHKSQSE